MHNTIGNIAKNQPVEEVLIGMEATGHYFKNPAASFAEMGDTTTCSYSILCVNLSLPKSGANLSKTDD